MKPGDDNAAFVGVSSADVAIVIAVILIAAGRCPKSSQAPEESVGKALHPRRE